MCYGPSADSAPRANKTCRPTRAFAPAESTTSKTSQEGKANVETGAPVPFAEGYGKT